MSFFKDDMVDKLNYFIFKWTERYLNLASKTDHGCVV